jgi:hypothetical protein
MTQNILFQVEITARTLAEAKEAYEQLIACAIDVSNSCETADIVVFDCEEITA